MVKETLQRVKIKKKNGPRLATNWSKTDPKLDKGRLEKGMGWGPGVWIGLGSLLSGTYGWGSGVWIIN